MNIGEETSFELSLSHDAPDAQTFEVFSSDVLWDLRTRDNLIVAPGQRFTTLLYVRPLLYNPGLYRVPVSVRVARSNIAQEHILMIELRSKDAPIRGYVPAIRGFFEMPKSIDPRQAVPIDVRLENQNVRGHDKLVLKFRSSLINKDFTVALGQLEKKSVHFDIPIDPLAAPARDVLKLSIIAPADGITYQFDFPSAEYAIAAYGGITEDVSDTKHFLGRTRVITIRNTGNANYAKRVEAPLNALSAVFSSASQKGAWSKGAYAWDVSLRPAEQQSITLRTNYWPPFIVLVLALIAVISYYLFRSPLVATKRAMVVAAKEGGISELKVLLSLRNRSPVQLKNVHLIDVVPNIAEVLRETELGSIAPENILRHEKKGTLVKWRLPHLEPHEERIITYHIRSKLGILGGLKLPVAIAKFEVKQGVERSVRSNTPTLVVGSKICI